jgi:cell division transport system permease protein
MNSKQPSMGPLARAFKQMKRDLWLQWAAIMSLTVSLAILGAYVTLCLNLSAAYQQMITGAAMMVVLEDSITEPEGWYLTRQLAVRSDVAKATFINKKKALDRFARQLGENADILKGLNHNPLPPTIEVFLLPGVSQENLAEQFRGKPHVEEVVTTRPWLRKMEDFANTAWELAMALGLLLFAGIVFLVLNTVRIAIYVRRDQLEVMDLVGASNWFIRIPFLIESLIQALVSSALASLLIWGLLCVLASPKALPLGFNARQLMSFPWQAPVIISFLAFTAAILGGFLGVSRALRPKGEF